MRGLRRGIAPVGLGPLLAWLGPVGLAMGLAVALSGCATSSAGEPSGLRSHAPTARVEIEDDGLPAQIAPSAAIRNDPDDPSQPFSRNYGLPPAARLSGPPTRLSGAEEEALIARAIAEHEMRRP
jgi:hypothetical protein